MINISKENLYWLAGLLEGEGCFHWGKSDSPLISLAMTDLDIVEKTRDLMFPNGKISIEERTEKHKTLYRFKVYGKNSIDWMGLLYPLMGKRRKERIDQIFELWSKRKVLGLERITCPKGHDLTNQNSYYLQGNHKICKICNKMRAENFKENNPDEYKERVKLYNKTKRNKQLERNAIKSIAIGQNISYEEAEKILLSLLGKEGGTIQ